MGYWGLAGTISGVSTRNELASRGCCVVSLPWTMTAMVTCPLLFEKTVAGEISTKSVS